MGQPWLSIVVPAYNAAKYLPACVDSIDPASHPDVELVIVDDGSTDATPAICDAFASKHANVQVIHRENGGLPAARNAGCSRAAGNWIWFVDSDDVISPYALDVLRPLAGDTGHEAIQIGFVRFSDGEEPAWPAPMPSENPQRVAAPDYVAGIYRGRYQHYMWSFLLRADALRSRNDHGGFPFREDFSLYEDVVAMEEYLRLIKYVLVCPWGLYGYRQSSMSMTKKHSNKAADSGLRAVLDLQRYETPAGLVTEKTCLEISLLFNAYKLIELSGQEADRLRLEYKAEIEKRVQAVGLGSLGADRLIRYALLKTNLLDLAIRWRYRG